MYCIVLYCTAVGTLAEGEQVVGLTTLGDELYVLRAKDRDQIEIYEAASNNNNDSSSSSYGLVRCMSVPDCRGVQDMTSCDHFFCLYVADHVAECIHRLDVGTHGTDVGLNEPFYSVLIF